MMHETPRKMLGEQTCSSLQPIFSRTQNIPCKLLNLANVSEGGCHDNGLVAECLVVLVDVGDRLHTRVLQA